MMKERNKPKENKLSAEDQRKLVKESIDADLKLGQTWYMVDKKWFEAWQQFVDYNETNSGSGETPGLIDNGELFDNSNSIEIKGKIRDNLVEDVDIRVVPQEAWDMFVDCYGTAANQKPIACPVIEQGTFNKTLTYELYPIEILLSLYKTPTEGQLERCSKGMTIGQLEKKMRKMFEIPDCDTTKLVGSYMSAKYDPLENKDDTLTQANIVPRQFVVLLVKEGANWPDPDKYKTSVASSTAFKTRTSTGSPENGASGSGSTSSENKYSYGKSSQTTNGYSSNTASTSSYSTRNSSSKQWSSWDYDSGVPGKATPGLCGLNNLGNTCFMNSSLQCMSNVPRLTQFFLDEQWKKDLNRDNPLGMHGQIAQSYADLIQTMWGGKYSSTAPRKFKSSVGAFAPRFSGYQQHDSQELMIFLLDGLHEDLNRIRKKPYVEEKPADGRPDQEVAEEAWQNYKLRNDSIVVDLLHGQLKSTLCCPDPECQHVSVTFDPFCYLQLPIPGKTTKKLTAFYVPSDPSQKPIKCRVKVPTDGKFSHLFEALSSLLHVSTDNMIATEVHRNRYHKLYHSEYSLRSIGDNDQIFVYKLEVPENHVTIGVYIREVDKGNKYGAATPVALGLPFLMALPEEVEFESLYDALRKRCSRFISEKEEAAHFKNADMQQNGDKEKTEEPMEISEGPKSPVKSATGASKHLFKMHLVSQYGSREHDDVQTNGATRLRNNSYLSIEFDKSVVGTVVNSEEAMNFEPHNSTYETEVSKKPSLSLGDCLDLFTNRETLGKDDTWYCPKCKNHVEATKQFKLWKLPQYLVIQLKRYKSSTHTYYREKNDAFVHYPIKNLDLSPWVLDDSVKGDCQYNLLSASNHYGGLGGGHYTAYAKNHTTGKWHYFDDSSVSSASEDSVVNKSGYILVYERSTTHNTAEESMAVE